MKTKQELKQFFENGDKPTQEQFWEWQDSYWHKEETIPQNKVEIDLSQKADLVDGKVPSSQLPSYVDDVLEFATFSELPNPGEKGKIYIATDTGKSYRWSGTMWQVLESTSEEGSNIANTDLTNTNPRTFTQKAAFTWDSLGSPYYWKGLTDQTNDAANFNKVLMVNPTTKEVAISSNGITQVTIPDTLPNQVTNNYTITVNSAMPSPAPSLPTYQTDLQNFMNTLYTKNFTQVPDNEWIFKAWNGDDNFVFKTALNGRVSMRSSVTSYNTAPAGVQEVARTSTLRLPNNKNWMYLLNFDVPSNDPGICNFQFGFNRDTNNISLNPIQGQVNAQYIQDRFGFAYNGAAFVSSPYNDGSIRSALFIKLGDFIHIIFTATAGRQLVASFNAEVNLSSVYVPTLQVTRMGNIGNNMEGVVFTTSNHKYWIEP